MSASMSAALPPSYLLLVPTTMPCTRNTVPRPRCTADHLNLSQRGWYPRHPSIVSKPVWALLTSSHWSKKKWSLLRDRFLSTVSITLHLFPVSQVNELTYPVYETASGPLPFINAVKRIGRARFAGPMAVLRGAPPLTLYTENFGAIKRR